MKRENKNYKISAHFLFSDVICKCKCGYSLINRELLEKLEKARMIACVPLIIDSWCRCKTYNATLKNSVPDSAHLKGEAVDIRAIKNYSIIYRSLKKAGFIRIGKGKNFIHCDIDKDKPQVEWRY